MLLMGKGWIQEHHDAEKSVQEKDGEGLGGLGLDQDWWLQETFLRKNWSDTDRHRVQSYVWALEKDRPIRTETHYL